VDIGSVVLSNSNDMVASGIIISGSVNEEVMDSVELPIGSR